MKNFADRIGQQFLIANLSRLNRDNNCQKIKIVEINGWKADNCKTHWSLKPTISVMMILESSKTGAVEELTVPTVSKKT